jgi:flagellar protein FlaG
MISDAAMTTTQPVGAPSGAMPLDISGSDKQNSASTQHKSLQSADEVAAAVQELNAAMKVVNTNLSFSIDNITKQTVVTVTDENTHEVIRQIPSEEMLKVSERIAELLGVLFDHAG